MVTASPRGQLWSDGVTQAAGKTGLQHALTDCVLLKMAVCPPQSAQIPQAMSESQGSHEDKGLCPPRLGSGWEAVPEPMKPQFLEKPTHSVHTFGTSSTTWKRRSLLSRRGGAHAAPPSQRTVGRRAGLGAGTLDKEPWGWGQEWGLAIRGHPEEGG